MKICHMTSAHDSDDIRIFQKECVFLAKNTEYDVYLVAPGNSRYEKNVNIIGIGDKPCSRLERMVFFTKKIYNMSISLDADIYHIHDPELLFYALKLKKHGKKVVFDSHENTGLQIKLKTYIPKIFRKLVLFLYRVNEIRICKKLDAVVYPDINDPKNPFSSIGCKVVGIDNLPILEEFKVDNSLKKENTCCCIGSLTEARGITNMLKAIKLLDRPINMILAGKFIPKEYKEELEKQGLLEGIDYRGVVTRQEVVEIYNESQIGLSTILPVGQYKESYNLPTKEYECMAMGIPVVRTDFETTRKIFDEYDFGISVNSAVPEDIAKAIDLLLSDEELRINKGKNGLRAAKEKFNWECEVKKLYNLYNDIMQK